MEKRKKIIEVKDVTKHYGKNKVLKGINLDIYEKDCVAIIGANGCGKTTLSEIISTVKQKSSGKIKYSFGETKKDICNNLGIQFQESTYPMYYKVIDIINFFVDATNSKISKADLTSMLKLFHLDGIENLYAQGLSGGQKQRLNILLAVVHSPRFLILDEVSTGLDIEAKTDIKNFIKQYIDSTHSTMILVSHSSEEIEFLANRVVVIHDGVIYEDLYVPVILKK